MQSNSLEVDSDSVVEPHHLGLGVANRRAVERHGRAWYL